MLECIPENIKHQMPIAFTICGAIDRSMQDTLTHEFRMAVASQWQLHSLQAERAKSSAAMYALPALAAAAWPAGPHTALASTKTARQQPKSAFFQAPARERQ